ncbi:ferric reductase Fre2p [Fusarium sp. NRRL 52700]|nr:ferric reductase Fre2p [Fusarium sp. NRRL 52700]
MLPPAGLLSLLASSANGYKTGLMGYGQSWYDTPRAYACRAVVGSAPLDCPSMDDHSTGTSEHSHGGSPIATCIAQNGDFLRTLVYCFSTYCADISASKLEAYWAQQATGDKSVSTEWTLPVLLEGPYRCNSHDVLKCDRVLLIGGGIGITGLLSWTRAHTNVKLAWSLKESSRSLLQDLEPALSEVADKAVLVGERPDVKALLNQKVEAD